MGLKPEHHKHAEWWQEGFDSYHKGREEEENPYSSGTHAHRWWYDGYEEASARDYPSIDEKA